MDTLPPPTTLEEARMQIRISHLEQLSHANLTLTPPTVEDDSTALPRCTDLKENLITWSRAHLDSIQKAIAHGALSGKNEVNWDYCFLAFLESMTVYLRKWDKLYEAVQTFKEAKVGNGKLSDNEMQVVHDLYEDSESDIKEIAGIWGMDFMQICGVYNGMFGTFNDGDPLTPFQRVLGALQKFVPTLKGEDKSDATFHITGHSLGGSYSSFCFAQCMMQNAGGGLPPGTQLGDLYNFGSPRVGQQAWSEAFYSNLSGKFQGGAWRIVNDKDIVPQVPSLLKFKKTGPFYHIDNGITIFPNDKPAPIPTERDGPGNKDIGINKEIFMLKLAAQPYHFPRSYYESMAYALRNR
ncbi:lipase class 3 [Fusarium austroafricanum]|uniref:Lipase class 3 n=1 Tax=Fusarium austroafricanum TaxID=2364996 RepID=A0A8H4KXF2_9HYPO|nr:lipase class 3 [Fusarium austroafricanum]